MTQKLNSNYDQQRQVINIPMLDLARQYRSIKHDIDAAVEKVLASGVYINGPQVQEFESRMALFLGTKHAIGVASGSDALLLALHALGISAEDKVIVPAFTFLATAGAVSRLGGIPVFADINPATYNLDIEYLRKLLSREKDIKAIITVHIFGLPCDMNQIMQLADEYNLYVIEDACQAINAQFQFNNNNVKAGTLGHAGCFSFFPSKNLSCFGDGGMVVTNHDALAAKIKLLKHHGSKIKYFHEIIGLNSRLDTIQAAILNVKLNHLEEWTKKRRQVAQLYNQQFKSAGLSEQVQLPEILDGHVFHQYVIQVNKRDELALYLKDNGIMTSIYYPLPLHLQECFRELGYQPGSLPIAEKACKRVLALPIDPELTSEEIAHIVGHIARFTA